jgi:DNA-binding NarL/FixJ family response regulator
MMTPIRLLIVDDHAMIREGLKQLIALVNDMVVASEASNGDEAMRRLEQGDFDLLLLDMTMPGLCGEDLIAAIHAQHPKLPILILSMHNEPKIAQRALKAGATGYLTKDNDPGTLLAAIRKVAVGSRFLDPAIAEQMAFDASGIGSSGGHELLTEREFQVMRMLAAGHCVNHIAAALLISNKTVSTHKARLMEKMGFSTNADLIRYALTHRLA